MRYRCFVFASLSSYRVSILQGMDGPCVSMIVISFADRSAKLFRCRPHSRSPSLWKREGERGKRWLETFDPWKTRYLRTLKPRVPSGPVGMRTILFGRPLPLGTLDFGWILLISCIIFSSGLFSSPRILFRASAYSCSLWNYLLTFSCILFASQ